MTIKKFVTKNFVLESYPEINYVLIARTEDGMKVLRFCGYVAAWGYDEKDGTWGQGHYFTKIDDALEYIRQIRIERGFGEEDEDE